MDVKKMCCSCFSEMNDSGTVCQNCGYDPANDEGKFPMALPHGTILAGKYITGRVLGQGGFGITYAAQDYKSKQLVAVKEYLPDTMASRGSNHIVTAYSGSAGENFNYGKDCFLEEAKTLAEFNGNENIVRIFSYFEEYGTAYFAMEYIEGESLQDYIKDRGGKILWEDAVKLLFPVMDALAAVHSRGIIHRDVTPDNIYITKKGLVKLLDFGAARYSLGDRSRSLDVVLKHGFAPKEQYTRHGRQGPYTDVYTLGASFYYALTGKQPPDAIERMEEDNLMPPISLGAAITAEDEAAILKSLSLQPQDRFQTMSDFKASLSGMSSTNQPHTGIEKEAVYDQTLKSGRKKAVLARVIAGIIAGIAGLLIIIVVLLADSRRQADSLPEDSAVMSGSVAGGKALGKAEQGVIIEDPEEHNSIIDDSGETENEDETNVWGYQGEWDLYATDWIFYYEDVYELTENDVRYLEQYYEYEYWPCNAVNGAHRDTLQMLINEIYAYHGYHFNDENMQEYFNCKSWYTDRGNSLEEAKARMNPVERKNIKLLEYMRNN